MKIGDHVIADGCEGIIVDTWKSTSENCGFFEWEVLFPGKPSSGCKQDCFLEKNLILLSTCDLFLSEYKEKLPKELFIKLKQWQDSIKVAKKI